MSQSERVRSRIQMLDERLTRLRAQKDRLVAREGQTERKRDTRRKIVIGGAILAAVEHEGVPALRSGTELVRWLDACLSRAHDRELFGLITREEPRATPHPSPYEPSGRSEAAVKDAAAAAPPSGAQRP